MDTHEATGLCGPEGQENEGRPCGDLEAAQLDSALGGYRLGACSPWPGAARDRDDTALDVLMEGCRGLSRLVYAQNPFYLLSAALVFYGVSVVFHGSAAATSRWWLLGLMTGYTVLMGGTAWGIVRFGKVWEDARSLLLIVVMLLLATSVSLDEVGIKQTQRGVPIILMALVCAIVISLALLRLLKIRLRAGYQWPYFLLLGLLYLYPLGIMLLQEYGDAGDMRALTWAVLGFPCVMGAGFLTLIPAMRRGEGYVRENGTPWRWPGFPLLLFMALAFGVCVRQYFLSISFLPIAGAENPFGFYCLTPFLLCLSVLGVEYAHVRGVASARWPALAAPLLIVWLTFSGAEESGAHRQALDLVTSSLGGPVFLTLLGRGGGLSVRVGARPARSRSAADARSGGIRSRGPRRERGAVSGARTALGAVGARRSVGRTRREDALLVARPLGVRRAHHRRVAAVEPRPARAGFRRRGDSRPASGWHGGGCVGTRPFRRSSALVSAPRPGQRLSPPCCWPGATTCPAPRALRCSTPVS